MSLKVYLQEGGVGRVQFGVTLNLSGKQRSITVETRIFMDWTFSHSRHQTLEIGFFSILVKDYRKASLLPNFRNKNKKAENTFLSPKLCFNPAPNQDVGCKTNKKKQNSSQEKPNWWFIWINIWEFKKTDEDSRNPFFQIWVSDFWVPSCMRPKKRWRPKKWQTNCIVFKNIYLEMFGVNENIKTHQRYN